MEKLSSLRKIKILAPEHVELFLDHRKRLSNESGKDGNPIFMVVGNEGFVRKPDEVVKSWTAEIIDTRWRRNWGAWSNGRIIGNFEIIGNNSMVGSHRSIVSVGIEKEYQREKIGKSLVDTGLRWLIENTSVEWCDFSVFADNQPSLDFCKQYNLQEIGYKPDALRINGVKINMKKMALNIRL